MDPQLAAQLQQTIEIRLPTGTGSDARASGYGAYADRLCRLEKIKVRAWDEKGGRVYVEKHFIITEAEILEGAQIRIGGATGEVLQAEFCHPAPDEYGVISHYETEV